MKKLSIGTVAAILAALVAFFTLKDKVTAAAWWPVSHAELAMTDKAVTDLSVLVLEGQISDRYSDFLDAKKSGDVAFQRRLRETIRGLERQRNNKLCEQWLALHGRNSSCPAPPSPILLGQ